MTRRVFIDCEFLDNGRTIDLISIGMVDEADRRYYAVNLNMPVREICQHRWLMENVVPALPLMGREIRHLPDEASTEYPYGYFGIDLTPPFVQPYRSIVHQVREWLLMDIEGSGKLELWANYASSDYVALYQLFGPMTNLPEGIPMYTHDLQTLAMIVAVDEKEFPKQRGRAHHALDDAIHDRDIFEYLLKCALNEGELMFTLRKGHCEEHGRLHAHPGWYTDLAGLRSYINSDDIPLPGESAPGEAEEEFTGGRDEDLAAAGEI